MSGWSDAQIEDYFRNRWKNINGYDPLEPGELTEDEYTDEDGYIHRDYDEPDYIKRSERGF